MDERIFQVEGMDCADEVAALRAALSSHLDVQERLRFDLLRGRMVVTGQVSEPDTGTILEAVSRTGMKAEVWEPGATSEDPSASARRRHLAAISGGLGTLLAALAVSIVSAGTIMGGLGGGEEGFPVAARVLFGLCILVSTWHILPKAWAAFRSRRPDMNLLMIIAVAGAVGIGEWFEAATVSFLFAVSLFLENWSVGRARRAVEALMDSAPDVVRIRAEEGQETIVHPADVTVGTEFFVRSGDKIPLDGEVTTGESDVNQAPITGESVPVPKGPGDEVFAGTLNGNGALVVRSSRPADGTTLANIVRLVTEAQSQRSKSERWVERFALRYTPSVIGLAITIAVAPPALGYGTWAEWFYRALVLLVIACPCALVISTPVTVVAALSSAARRGVLIKGGAHLEEPGRLQAIALDKTGTLTRGEPKLVGLHPLNDHSEDELLARAGALEFGSSHPLARAILEAAGDRQIITTAPEDGRIVPGRGAVGTIDGREYWLGSHRFLRERGQNTPEVEEAMTALTAANRTVVAVGTTDHVCGLIELADEPREGAVLTITALRRAGVDHIVMLTGDNEAVAHAVAGEVPVSEVHAELLPEDKADLVADLVGEYRHVAMVGDGVNDAPAMARATLSIAMGAVGSDVAVETADVALMSDDLSRLPWLIHHSRRALSVIRQNVTIALGVKAAFVILTIIGYSSLWAAITADMGASLLVTFNGLRLLRSRNSHD